MRGAFVLLLATGLAGPATAGMFGPSDVQECRMEAAREAKTNGALKILVDDCRKRFPAKALAVERPADCPQRRQAYQQCEARIAQECRDGKPVTDAEKRSYFPCLCMPPPSSCY